MTTPSSFMQFELLLRIQPCIHGVIELHADDASDAAAVRERCRAAVLTTQATFRADKLLREKEGDLTRALVALLDEFGALRFRRYNEWISLQGELLREAMLGDDVVAAMERLCAGSPRDDPERAFVYYLCIALGFKGCYGDSNIERDGGKKLAILRRKLRESLIEAGWFAAKHPAQLGPVRPPTAGPPASPGAPLWPWLLALCLLLTVLTQFLALRHLAVQARTEVLHQISNPSQRPGARPSSSKEPA